MKGLDIRWLIIGVITLLLVITFKEAEASPYDFPYKEDVITMDVVKTYGGGGTYRCPSVRDCYIKTLEAEARGANQYCESLTIKRNGRVVWWRKYK